jgi:hypothetical protein
VLDKDTLEKLKALGHSRFPVYSGDKQNLIGILLVKTLLALDPNAKQKVSDQRIYKLLKVAPDEPLYDLLNEFQKGGGHMAAVRDPKTGDYIGILTLEDVLEQLIQEQIYDETDNKIVNIEKLQRAPSISALKLSRAQSNLRRSFASSRTPTGRFKSQYLIDVNSRASLIASQPSIPYRKATAEPTERSPLLHGSPSHSLSLSVPGVRPQLQEPIRSGQSAQIRSSINAEEEVQRAVQGEARGRKLNVPLGSSPGRSDISSDSDSSSSSEEEGEEGKLIAPTRPAKKNE